ncbi:MAG TPA: PPOX class F420-dependent oxidoreductase [Myxococcales bacterium]|nr:PPOX class F420-dependent oxidoreductase [Myxococcales bacterium]
MSAFTEKEIAYLQTQRLGRMATVSPAGKPHVVPVGFRFDADRGVFEVGGHSLAQSKKFKDLQQNPAIAFVVDDLASVTPWVPRGIEVRGRAELFEEGGERFGAGWDKAWIRIHPERIVAWGIDAPPFSGANKRSVPPGA